jgi:hypothetical protein
MKNRIIIIISALLFFTIGNYFGIIYNGSVRAVEFLSISAIGALAGILLSVIFGRLFRK